MYHMSSEITGLHSVVFNCLKFEINEIDSVVFSLKLMK